MLKDSHVALDGQRGRHTKNRTVLHETAQDNHQYFWILNTLSGGALTWDSGDPTVTLQPMAATSNQIWVVDNIGAIFTGRGNRRLSAAQDASGRPAMLLMESGEVGSDQWNTATLPTMFATANWVTAGR